jgi:hypothetical protein
MYDTTQDLLDAFAATPDTLRGVLRGCTHEQAAVARGGDENWSVVEVICHLRDAEENALSRMRLMRDEQNPRLAAYDQDAWAIERNYAVERLETAVAAFLQLRGTYLAELAALSGEAWWRRGQHEEQGDITIHSHTLHVVSHDAIHLAQIARQLQSL